MRTGIVSGLIAMAALLAARAACAESTPVQVTKDVEVTLQPDKTEVEIGEPVLVDIVYKNVGKVSYWVDEDYFGTFHAAFVAKDAAGNRLPDPFSRVGISSIDGPSVMHELKPGDTLTITRMLNESVRFPKAGTYTIEASWALVRTGQQNIENDEAMRLPTAAGTTLAVKDFNKEKRQREIIALRAAYRVPGEPLPDGLPVDKKYIFSNSKIGIVRLLAFYDDPTLADFFLDVMEAEDWNGYARDGLLGLSDRAAAIKACDARLEHPESHNITKLAYDYGMLKVPMERFDETKETIAQRRDTVNAIYDRALAFLKQDKTYDHADLILNLPSGADELFLMEYLLRSKPTPAQIRWCANRMDKLQLPAEFVPQLEQMLTDAGDTTVTDMAIGQLIRMDRAKYLPILKADKESGGKRFSAMAYKLLE